MLETVARFVAAHALAMLMLSVGLRTRTSLVRDISDRWRVLARALLVVWIAVPLLAVAVVLTVRPPPVEAGTLVVLAICPGVPMVMRKAKTKYGDERTSLLVLISTALAALVMVPMWAAVLTRVTPLELSFRLRDVAAVLLPTVFVPYAIGRIIVDVSPRVAAKLAKIAQALFVAGVVVVLAVVVAKMVPALRDLGVRAFVAAFLIPFGAAVLGYVVTPGSLDDRVSVTYASALGNPALALGVLGHSYKDLQVLPLVFAFVLVRAIALIPFNLWFKHRHREDEPRTIRPKPLVPAHGGAHR